MWPLWVTLHYRCCIFNIKSLRRNCIYLISRSSPYRAVNTISRLWKPSQLVLCREIIVVCSEIHTNTLCGQNVELYIKIQSVPRSKYSASVIQPSQLVLCREIIAVCSKIHTKRINTFYGQNVELYIKIQSVPRSKYSASVIQPSQLVLCREIIAVCSEIHTKRINTFYGQNVELYIKI